MKSVAVITATTGRKTLAQAIDSVAAQTYPCKHYVIVDGNDDVQFSWDFKGEVVYLPNKTGLNGVMNGAIIAMSAYIATEDYICFLDDDNWFERDHVASLVSALEEKNAAYAYSLRNLVNPDGTPYDLDIGESTGHYGDLVDVNCYLMRRDLAAGIAPLWYHTTGDLMVGDRYVWAALRQNNTPWAATWRHTVNYRISARGEDLRPFFFMKNIQAMARHGGQLPWTISSRT